MKLVTGRTYEILFTDKERNYKNPYTFLAEILSEQETTYDIHIRVTNGAPMTQTYSKSRLNGLFDDGIWRHNNYCIELPDELFIL